MKTILVTGGAGFIGSHTNLLLNDLGYTTIILDNLSRGNPKYVIQGTLIEGDIDDINLLDKLFKEYKFDCVMHFAAFTDVGESVKNPKIYYQNNVFSTVSLLGQMVKWNVNNFIFSSSAAVYGQPKIPQVNETAAKNPLNPYGRSKWMTEEILEDFSKSYGLNYVALRYFNAAGGDPTGRIFHTKFQENNLIPIILNRLSKSKTFTIFGTDYATPDGTCIRDYIHVMDIAHAHELAFKYLLRGGLSTAFNLGNGKGYSVREVINMVEKVTGLGVNAEEGPRREGDPATLLADATKARNELNWTQKYPDLQSMIATAWPSYSV